MIQITYLSHSGFFMETDSAYLLFDYYKGTIPKMVKEKPLYVFVSHSHHDHYNKEIYKLDTKMRKVTYMMSDDIDCHDASKVKNSIFMKPDEKRIVDSIEIETFRSTDLGVAFLIHTDGKRIFHAGDLHWWHWIGEPEQDNEEMKKMYLNEMKKLEGHHYDIAFLVLDPRQEGAFDWGFDYFLKHTDTDVAFPMHFWKDYSVIDAYKYSDKAKEVRHKVMDVCREGQTFLIK